MDWVETAVMRKAGLRGEMLMFSSSAGAAGQHPLLYLQSPLLSSPSAEEPPPACASVDRSGAWENFSVDDLLDLGGGKEQNGAGEDDFLRAAEAEEEEDDDEEEEEERTEKEEKDSSSTAFNDCSSSALSFQALPSPSSGSDPILPAGDLADLEWVSRFVDDSYSEFPSAVVAPAPLQNHHAPAPAPSPEAEAPRPQRTSSVRSTSKRTWGSCCFSTDSLVVPAKLRSKRSGRTAGRVWSLGLPPLLAESSTSSCSSSASCSASSSIFSCLLYEKLDSCGGGQPHHPSLGGPGGGNPVSFQPALLPEVKKKKGRKPKLALTVGTSAAASGGCGEHAQARRRCTHCGVDKTPQWRAGPMGAKTLCNACGVRYKSGRLLPEYRPAGSPTFLSQVHSNSHRKVLEMRRRKELPEEGAASSPRTASCSLLPPPPQVVVAASQPYGVV